MKRFDLSVRQRLGIGSAVIASMIAVLGITVVVLLSHVRTLREEKLRVIAPRAVAAERLQVAIYEQAVAFRNFVISGTREDEDRFRRTQRDVLHQMDVVAGLPKTPDGHAVFDRITDHVSTHQRSFENFFTLQRAGADATVLRRAEQAISALRSDLVADVRLFAGLQNAQMLQADEDIQQALVDLRAATVVVTFLIILASLATSLLVGRAVRLPAVRLAAAADALRNGSFEPALALQAEPPPDGQPRFRDELREAAKVFGNMAAVLQRREARLSAHSRLAASLGTTLDPAELARRALGTISDHLNAPAGVVYLVEADEPMLQPIASLAIHDDAELLSVGEGVPGRAASERSLVVVRDIPSDAKFRIHLGVDAVPPRCVAAAPMVVKDRLVGVMAIASLRDLDGDALAFFEQAAGHAAVTIDNALAHVHIAALADELRDKNEDLTSQNEELQAQSEELHAQGEELQAQNEELQAQSAELRALSDTLQEQQESLERSNQSLVRAEAQKNQFLAVLGHELRNPLAAIQYAAGLLTRHADESRDARAREVIERQTSHLAKLLDDLLDVGRITSGKIELSRKPIDLGAAIERVVEAFGNTALARPTLRLQCDRDLWADADETRIEQIVTNLLTNAVKFTPADGLVTVRVTRDGGDAVVAVEDTGAGIEPELLPHVFDLFVQGRKNGEQSRGLGVGLTLVRELVELHRGSIDAKSAGRGKGTTITVRIPSIPAPERREDPSPKLARVPASRSVVLVEDNPDVRSMMHLLLAKAGHTVAEAHDGPSGLERVQSVVPHVALVDLDLPGFDGCEIARRVRLDPTLSRVVLIALSGYGRPEDRARALAAGFDEHLVKPVDLERLSSAVAEMAHE